MVPFMGRGKQEPTASRTGTGTSHGHFGEVFQGQLEHWSGQRRRCLLSLPCAAFATTARYEPNGTSVVEVHPRHKVRARRSVEVMLEYLEVHRAGGLLTIESDIPEGKGNGSSTSDCVAGLRAAASAFGIRLGDQTIARLAVQAERASDNTMFGRAVLFAQREGTIVEDYGKAFPVLEVIGCDTEEAREIDTLSHPPATYCSRQIQTFELLRGALRRAMRTSDIALLGRVATTSALINQEFLPKPGFRELSRLVWHAGALGLAVAHSGTVAAILLDPRESALDRKAAFIQAELRNLRFPVLARFSTAPTRTEESHGDPHHLGGAAHLPSGPDPARPQPHRRRVSPHEGLSG
jgi:uncharacterized protein involved in propanediol utilization